MDGNLQWWREPNPKPVDLYLLLFTVLNLNKVIQTSWFIFIIVFQTRQHTVRFWLLACFVCRCDLLILVTPFDVHKLLILLLQDGKYISITKLSGVHNQWLCFNVGTESMFLATTAIVQFSPFATKLLMEFAKSES